MELIKNADRILKMPSLKAITTSIRELGTFCKWKEIESGRIQVKFTVYECVDKFNGKTFFALMDGLNRLASAFTFDKAEYFNWLKAHDYLPEKEWYTTVYGMSEETWNEWNNAE